MPLLGNNAITDTALVPPARLVTSLRVADDAGGVWGTHAGRSGL